MAQDNEVRFRLNLFQCWQLVDEKAVVNVAWRQQRLISVLALYGSRQRSYLSGLLWPESPQRCASESLRVSLHLLSRQVPGLIVNGGQVLSLSPTILVDVHQFACLMKSCGSSAAEGTHEDCLAAIRQAELLPGWYEDWVAFEQSRFRSFRLRALVNHARRWLEQSQPEKALEAAELALELEPIDESNVRYLMQAELDLGNRAGALQAYEALEERLNSALGVTPSALLSNFAASIRRSE